MEDNINSHNNYEYMAGVYDTAGPRSIYPSVDVVWARSGPFSNDKLAGYILAYAIILNNERESSYRYQLILSYNDKVLNETYTVQELLDYVESDITYVGEGSNEKTITLSWDPRSIESFLEPYILVTSKGVHTNIPLTKYTWLLRTNYYDGNLTAGCDSYEFIEGFIEMCNFLGFDYRNYVMSQNVNF